VKASERIGEALAGEDEITAPLTKNVSFFVWRDIGTVCEKNAQLQKIVVLTMKGLLNHVEPLAYPSRL